MNLDMIPLIKWKVDFERKNMKTLPVRGHRLNLDEEY